MEFIRSIFLIEEKQCETHSLKSILEELFGEWNPKAERI